MKNTLSCREATKLLLEDEECDVSTPARLALQVHVKVCFACQRFVAQLNFMRRATRAWRKHVESDDDNC